MLAWRGDDDGHNVLSFFSDPSLDANLAIQINKTRDVVLSFSYVFTSIHGPWQWRRDTGSNVEDGNSITETEWAVWNDGVKPDLKPEGFLFSLSIRKIRFCRYSLKWVYKGHFFKYESGEICFDHEEGFCAKPLEKSLRGSITGMFAILNAVRNSNP